MKSMVLYGLAGADQQYMCVEFWIIFEQDISVQNITWQAAHMKMKHPNISAIYCVDNRPGLKSEMIKSVRKCTIESCAIFKDTLEREGIRVL